MKGHVNDIVDADIGSQLGVPDAGRLFVVLVPGAKRIFDYQLWKVRYGKGHIFSGHSSHLHKSRRLDNLYSHSSLKSLPLEF
jgi:hypothetical protein